MKLVIFYIIYPLVWLLSKLPMRILYLFSDVLFLLMYYVIKYRKAVVMQNLTFAFPEKTEKEKHQLAKKFFKHFTDLIVESLKAITISEKEVLKRYHYKNPELVNKYSNQGRNIALVGAHICNWEWSFSLPLVLDSPVFGAYNGLRDHTFENKLKAIREKFGVIGIKTSDFFGRILENFDKKMQGAYILLSDQSPLVEKTFYWTEFFGVKVPVHTGAEMISKKFDLVVINYKATKIKRGYYETEFELITDNPREFKDFEITDTFLRLTEKNIAQQPEFYLWSHKRFKHKDKFEEWQQLLASKKTKK